MVNAEGKGVADSSARNQKARRARQLGCHVPSLVSMVIICTGCAVTPETKQSLATYVQASHEVEEATKLFHADFADSVKLKTELDSVVNGPPPVKPEEDFPSEFKPPSAVPAVLTPAEKALASSRQALAVIREYNEALVALAEGRSKDEIKSQIKQFGESISTVAKLAGFAAPGIGQFAAIGAKVIQLAQDAENLQQLKEAVANGRGPVEEILAVFEAQTESLYRDSVTSAKPAQIEVRKEIARTARPIGTFLNRYSPPTDSILFNEVAGFQQEVVLIGERTRTIKAMPTPFPFDTTKPSYDQEAHSEMKVFMASLRISDAKYKAVVARQNAYYDLMERYVEALHQMRDALEALHRSLTAPVDLSTHVNGLLKSAFQLRDAMREFRNSSVRGTL
jgi:hypothetical protein